MNLRFSIPPEVLRQRGIEISQLVMGVLPGSAAHIDEGKGILYVTLPQGVHPALATDTVVRALAGIGITAYFMADTPNYAPPIQMGEKKRRGVPLPVFIVSLIAVALAACILTVFTSGALSGAWMLGADSTLGTGKQAIALSCKHRGKIGVLLSGIPCKRFFYECRICGKSFTDIHDCASCARGLVLTVPSAAACTTLMRCCASSRR